MKANPILTEVFKNRFSSIAEEMGMTLMRTSFSPNIKERRDFSCAIFDNTGEMVAQAAHIPVHLGSMPLSVKAAIDAVEMTAGDMVALNDPFKGGTHLPDITLVAPVFFGDLAFYVANRAHHADVGGMTPGSMPLSRSIFQEGVIIPPLKLVESGEINESLLRFFLNNVRTPTEREGDLKAQIMANLIGIRRAKDIVDKYGPETTLFYSRALMDHSEAVTRAAIRAIPDGIYEFEDFLDSDGITIEPVPIRARVTITGDTAHLDFSESGDQVRGSLNAVRAITISAVLYVLRSLISEDIATNAGCMRPIQVATREGSVVDARFPAAVAGGNVETSQRIVDTILGALAKAIPNKIAAASQGTMNNITIGGYDPRHNRSFAYYETLGGGMGASATHNGESAVHSHMTNTLNTPVEALEYSYPFLVREYSVRSGTGGEGRRKGGDGLVREIELLTDAEVTVMSERRTRGPYGLFEGSEGSPGRNTIVRKGLPEAVPGKFHAEVSAGDRVRIETPGGGGYGPSEDPRGGRPEGS
jgi:N-methylhydantoinase B